MSRNLNELTPAEWDAFVDQLKAITPAHTWWTATQATWSTPKALWTIEIHRQFHRTVIRQGTDNKWTNFEADATWHLSLLEHLGALE